MWYRGLEERLRGEQLDLKLTVFKLGPVKQEEEGVQEQEGVQVQVQEEEGVQVG